MNKGVIIQKRYEVVKLIGQGGMADVYLAYDILLERDVAIKILRNELSNDAVSLLRFKHEAVAVSKLSHPNIIEIYDIGEFDSRQYIVMEYVPGKTLKELIVERGGLYKDEAVHIMKQLVSAVQEAHHNHIIHRDIKPQNILVKSDGSVIITDFGIALAQNALHLTQKEMVMGSVHYLAPELARGETATFQSDIYALGIVFYELLSGHVPFKGDSAIQIAMKQINENIPSIREYNPTIPQPMENCIVKATFKNREARYKSADEMLEDIMSVLDVERAHEEKIADAAIVSQDDQTKVIESLDTVSTINDSNQDDKKSRKQKLMLIAVISLTLIAIITGVYFFLNREPKIEQLSVPNVVNLQIDEAREKLLEAGFIVGEISREMDEQIDNNYIISSDPKAYEKVDKGTSINLIVSEGKYFVFENYVGKNFDLVRIDLENKLNINVRVEYISDSTKSAGVIVSQSVSEGEKINPNTLSEVKFVVVKPVEIIIPSSIYGMDINAAKALLEGLGASVRLDPILDSNGNEAEGSRENIVEYSTPSRNSTYVQSEGNQIVLHYYSHIKVDIPDPIIPEEEPPAEEEDSKDKDDN